MIIDALLGMVVGLLTTLLGLLPTEPVPPDLAAMWNAALDPVSHWFAALNEFLPLDDLATAIGMLLAWMVAIHVFKLVAWVLELIHVAGTSG